jgi:hypothetical protein
MSIDPVNIAALNTQSKSAPTSPAGKEQSHPQPVTPPAQTGAAGPPVITNFSAAALLTAHAVGVVGQTADQEPVKKKDDKKEEANKRQSDLDSNPEFGSRVNTRI